MPSSLQIGGAFSREEKASIPGEMGAIVCLLYSESPGYVQGALLQATSAKRVVKGAPRTTLEHVTSQKSVESPANEFAKDGYDLNRNLGWAGATKGSWRCEKRIASLSEGA